MCAFITSIRCKSSVVAECLAALCFFPMASSAQHPAARIAAAIDNSERVSLKGTHPPLAKTENDAGWIPSP
jgi:hypothetical protein